MRYFRTVVLLVAAMLASATMLAADKTFYVSTKGDDAAAGTRCKPWRTPEAAAAKAAAFIKANPGTAVTVLFEGGEYFLDSAVKVKALESPLTLAPLNRKPVTFSGQKAVTDWEPAFGAVLKADLRKCGIEDFGVVAGEKNRVDLYFDGVRQQIARWPDEGFTNGGKAVGPTEKEETWIHVHGTNEGMIEYTDPRIEKWVEEKDPQLFGYWYWDWCGVYHKPASVDTVKHVLTVDQPFHKHGYRDNCRFYGFNLLCELDSPGEYYIDREEGVIYWYPQPGFDAEDPRTAVSVFGRSSLINIIKCKNLTVRDINLVGARNDGIHIKGGENVTVDGCHIECIGNNAISIEGGSGHKVTGCLIEQLGCGGIIATGGNRKTLEPAGFEVCDDIIRDFTLYQRTYAPAVGFTGCGMSIHHNRFQNSPSSALGIYGNDIDISFNQIFDVVTESDDQGGLDCYYNYSFRRIVLKNNYWRNIRGGMFAGAAAIRFDDIISGQVVEGNVFEGCGGAGFGAVQINGGKDNRISGNLFYDCHYAVSCIPWSEQDWRNKYMWQEGKMTEVDAFSELYLSRYPELKEPLHENISRNYVSDNLAVKVGALFLNGNRNVVSNNTVIDKDVQPLSYYLQDSVLSKYGIEPIPFDEIGPRHNKWE